MKEAIIYLLAISIAEIVTVFVHPVWGMVCHALVLVGVITRSAMIDRRATGPTKEGLVKFYRELLAARPLGEDVISQFTSGPFDSSHVNHDLFLSLSLVPLIRIISLSMPLVNIPQIWWYPIIYTPLMVAALVVVRLLGYRIGQVGMDLRYVLVQLSVGLSGFLFGVTEYFILRPETLITELTWQRLWLPAVILLTCTGFVEEFIFRGVLQRTAVDALGEWRGLVYVSVLFAVVHVGYRSLLDVIFVFAVAMFFAWVVKKTGSLLGVTLAHGITNILLYLVIPFFF